MIDVKTLRYRSIVANKHGFQFEVVGIFKDQILCDFKGNEGDVFEFKPSELFGVTLSEEWLEKFGFEKIYEQRAPFERVHFENKNCWVYIGSYGFELELITLHERHNLCRQYQYVHQLQNLISALTGEELKLK